MFPYRESYKSDGAESDDTPHAVLQWQTRTQYSRGNPSAPFGIPGGGLGQTALPENHGRPDLIGTPLQ